MVNMIRLINLVCTSSGKSSQFKPSTTPHHSCQLIQRYSQQKGGQEEIAKERASSTLEVMEQFSHEKEERISDEKTRRSFADQPSDAYKMKDAAKQAVSGDDADPKTVKKKKYPGETLPP
ncbi:DNA ligase [Bienertia sinuspersici]